jgi:hypothetical protein
MAELGNEKAVRTPRRRWLRFSLATLLLLVTLSAVGAWLFTNNRDRWWVMKLAQPETADAAWQKIVEINKWEPFHFDKGRPIEVWAQHPVSILPGYVWVRQGDSLRCVSPHGQFLDHIINIDGQQVQVLWNGMLPDGQPGIALFRAPGKQDGFLICVSAVDSAGTRLITSRVVVTGMKPGVTAAVTSAGPPPAFVFATADGKYREEFEFPYGPAQDDTWEATSGDTISGPWRKVSKW